MKLKAEPLTIFFIAWVVMDWCFIIPYMSPIDPNVKSNIEIRNND